MLEWENKYYKIQEHDHICNRVEKIGTSIRELCNPKRVPLDKSNRRWFKDFKVWEYPYIYSWLKRLGADNKKLKIMDFGCWMCPFPQFLAEEFDVEVWGVDNDDWKDIGKIGHNKVKKAYPNVNYFFDDIEKIQETDFDAIFSCSVLEHIPQDIIPNILDCLKEKLSDDGKMLHIVDFYFPNKPGKEKKRTNFWKICQEMNWKVKNEFLCPGNPNFNIEKIITNEEINFLREWNLEARIAIGDDI